MMGGMQMGVDTATSVVDADGRMHQLDNIYVADGVFATSGGSNPTVKGHEELPGGGRENCPLVATRSARS